MFRTKAIRADLYIIYGLTPSKKGKKEAQLTRQREGVMQDVAHAIGEETLPFPVEVLMMHEEMNATRITSFGFCLDGELLMRKGL
jgi:hypothetical protein